MNWFKKAEICFFMFYFIKDFIAKVMIYLI